MINPVSLLVASALKNAKENDYDFNDWTDEDVALDMICYDADLEDAPFETVLYYVNLQRRR